MLEDEGFQAYKIHQIPALRTCDKEMRISFAEWYLDLDTRTRRVIWWSDECWFIRLESDIIMQNCRVWSRSQPNATVDRPKKSKAAKYWAGINGKGEIVFREVSDTMDAAEYIKMLNGVFPWMKMRHRMFQQGGGASIHRAGEVTRFLDSKDSKGWIGVFSSMMEWPPHLISLHSTMVYGHTSCKE